MSRRRAPAPLLRTALAVFASILLVLTVPRVARAATIEMRDPVTDFRVALEGGTAVLCRIKPEPAAPTDVCATVAERMDLKKLKSAFAVVAIVHDDWTLAVVAVRTASLSEHRPKDDQVSLFALGIERYLITSKTAPGMSGRTEGTKYDALEIAGARAIRYDAELTLPTKAVQETISIFASGGTVSISFVAPVGHLDDVRALVDSSVETMHVRPPPIEGPKLNTKPAPPPPTIKAATVPQVVGFGATGIIGAAIVGALWWRSSSERDRSAPQRAARASWLCATAVVSIFAAVNKLTSFPGLLLGCAVTAAALLLAGLSFSSYALISVPRVGRDGVLQPALVGLALLILLAALIAFGVMKGLSQLG